MTPFGIQSIQPYLASGPPSLLSSEYAAAFNDVFFDDNLTLLLRHPRARAMSDAHSRCTVESCSNTIVAVNRILVQRRLLFRAR